MTRLFALFSLVVGFVAAVGAGGLALLLSIDGSYNGTDVSDTRGILLALAGIGLVMVIVARKALDEPRR